MKLLGSLLAVVLLSGCADHQEKDPVDALCRVAQKARASGNTETAIKFYSKIVEERPDKLDAYTGLAEAYIDMKLLDAAEDVLKKGEKQGADKKRIAYLRGKSYLLRGKLPEAKKEFLKYHTVDCMNALGAVYDNEGNHEQAQAMYKRVIAVDPKYIDAYNNLGLSLMLTDNYKDAIFYLENACTLPEANRTYRGNLALAYGLSGQIPRAREVYSQDYEGDELDQKVAYLEDIIAQRE